jgi:hypothetical protein
VPTYEPPPPTKPGVRTDLPERDAALQLRSIDAVARKAQSDYFKAIDDFIKYRAGGPPPGGWSQQVYSAMMRDIAEKEKIWADIIPDLKAAQAEVKAATNRAITAPRLGPDLYQIAAGQAGVAGAIR